MSRSRKRSLLGLAAVALIVLTTIAAGGAGRGTGGGDSGAPWEPGMEVAEATIEYIEPQFEWTPNRQTEAQRLEMQRKFEARKELVQARYPTSVPGPPVSLLAIDEVPETMAGGDEGYSEAELEGDFAADFEADPDRVARINKRNPMANTASTLAEPVAAMSGNHILAGGNTHFEYSGNAGVTYTDIPFPGGPMAAPNVCCDPDVQHFPGRGTTIFSILYLNSGATQGAVRLFVRRQIDEPTTCSYTLGYGPDVVPDYPHLGKSNRYLYLSTNNVGTSWSGSQMKRIPVDDLADCVTASVETYTYTGSVGQRVFVPAEGTTETMYWLTNENTTQSRLFSWPEASGSITSWVIDRAESTFSNPDCRGGVGNYDWIERSTAWSIAGFRVRSALHKQRYLCSYWNVGPDASHTQGHVHAACFDTNDSPPTLVAQPHIWNSGACFGFPAVSANVRGDLGLSIGYGGQSGGGGTAAKGQIGIYDDVSGGGMGFFGTVYLTASGSRNRSDGRHGDYYTVRPSYPCGTGYIATNYGLLQSTRNVRVVRFSRGRDWRCMLEFGQRPNSVYD